jgi:hypothetical protein
MADDIPRAPRRSATPEATPEERPSKDQQDGLFADLSGMAREAVRSPADPRLDAHLAFLGLGEDPVPAMGDAADPTPGGPTAATRMEPTSMTGSSEIDQLRASVARLERTVAEAEARLRQLTFVIGVIAIASVLALIITIAR